VASHGTRKQLDVPQSCGNCWYWRLPSPGSTRRAASHPDIPACGRVSSNPSEGVNQGDTLFHTDMSHWCEEWRPCWSGRKN